MKQGRRLILGTGVALVSAPLVGVNIRERYRRLAYYADRILKGAHPSTLPVELPLRLEMVLNLKTAKALVLGIPQSLLLRADEVIQ